MEKIRFKFNYDLLIKDFNLKDEFDLYCLGKNLSKNRLARAFCLKKDLIKFAEWRIVDFFLVPEARVYEEHGRYLL